MTTLTLSRERAEPVSAASPPTLPVHVGIRALLRDTALLVATLSSGGLTEDYEAFRRNCKKLVDQFDTALQQQACPKDVREDAIAAQCALLDETALRHLHDDKKVQWVTQPLQVEQLKYHNAGEYVFERLAMRMRETPANVDLLECYSAILGLGFMGRYALEGKAKRDALIESLNKQIAQLRAGRQPDLLVERPGRRVGEWFRQLSPWAIAGLGLVVALIVWMAWHVALDAQLASIVPGVSKP